MEELEEIEEELEETEEVDYGDWYHAHYEDEIKLERMERNEQSK